MSQLTQKKSLNKDKQNKLGQAPNDIYDLENEIAEIYSAENPPIRYHQQHIEESVIKHDNEHQDDEYKLFSTSNISTAKQSLQNGSKIKMKLPDNIKPHALIAMTHALGFDTTKLQRVFQNSSVVVKHIIDDYVSNIQSQYASLSDLKHPYQSSANGGYLFHCKQVDALQCDTDLSAKVRISMDLDYGENVENDRLFETRFMYELSHKVFKGSTDNIRIEDIRSGSIVVVITGITLITLATVGLMALSVQLVNRRRTQRQMKRNIKSTEDKAQKMTNIKSEQKQKQKQKQIQAIPPESMIYSIFNKIKTGINSLNEQYTSSHEEQMKVEATPNGMDDMYAQLIEMGFADGLCQSAAKTHPSDINEAINWITEREQKEEAQCVADIVHADKKENLILHINDPLWVNRKNNLWSATVVALTRDQVTVEYDHGGPYLWTKTETFALNDAGLIQREPGMNVSPTLEGCVEITKSNGGYIRAWKTGFYRPMADL